MAYVSNYLNQVSLLLQVLPTINEQPCFALKGGTAINLFFRNMPRLSVDIDLAYLPIEPREQFLKNITLELETLAENISKHSNGKYKINKFFIKENNQLSKLMVSNSDSQIIIEPNLVLRGSVFECETKTLCPQAQDEFLSFFKIKTLSLADVYAGKFCAALSRQHPRDLFDVKLLFENEGITDAIRQAFLVYLASSPRPMHEMLNPNPTLVNLRQAFNAEFVGMTSLAVTCDDLVKTRIDLIQHLLKSFTNNERQFLISIKEGNPNWSHLPIPGIEKLPGIAWKVMNIRKMDKQKQVIALDNLKRVLA